MALKTSIKKTTQETNKKGNTKTTKTGSSSENTKTNSGKKASFWGASNSTNNTTNNQNLAGYVGGTAYNSNANTNLNNIARNVTDVTTQKTNTSKDTQSKGSTKTSTNALKNNVKIGFWGTNNSSKADTSKVDTNKTSTNEDNKTTSTNSETPKSYADYYNQMIKKQSDQQVEWQKNYKEQKIAKGTEKYESQLAEKQKTLDEHKKNDANYELNLYQYSDNDGNVISAKDYKDQSDSIKSDYEALIAKYETDGDGYAFTQGYNEIKARADKLSTYSNLNYNQSLSTQYEANKARLSELSQEMVKLYDSNGAVTDGAKLSELSSEYQKLTEDNTELKSLMDDVDTLKETGYYENLKTNGSEEELAEFNEYVSHYADNVVERLATIGVSSVVNIASSAINIATFTKDKGLEASALVAEKIAENLHKNGTISEEDYNNLLETTNNMKAYESADSEVRQWTSDSLADLKSYITAGVDNPVEKFAYDSLSSASDFLLLNSLAPGASLGIMTAQSATNRYYELKQAVDENGNPLYTEKQCLLNAALTGGLSYLTEKLPTDNVAKILTNSTGKYMVGYTLDYIMKSLGSQALAEGAEEAIEALGDPIIDAMTLGTPIEYDAGEIFYAAALGAASGGIVGSAYVGTVLSNINFVCNTNEQYQSLKADKARLEAIRAEAQTQEEIDNINAMLQSLEKAQNVFINASVFGDAITIKDTEDLLGLDQAKQTVAAAITPNVTQNLEVADGIQNAQKSIDNITQMVLQQNKVNMSVDQYRDLSKESRNRVNNTVIFAQKMGVDVSFDSTLNNAINGYNINGQIVLNPNSNSMQSAILGHEVTHNLENSKKYAKLVELIKSTTDYQGILNDVTRAYKGVTENLESEAIAKYIEQNIANDSFIESVIKYDSSFANRVFNNIKSMFDSNEKVKIENAWMRAFENAKNSGVIGFEVNYNNGELAYSLADNVDKEEQLNIIQNAKIRSKATYEKFVSFNNVDEIKTFEEAINDNPKYDSFFNERGANKALEDGEVTVYSSTPIKQGAIVSPSKEEIQKHATYKSEIYESRVNLKDVAWANTLQGIYANTEYDAKNNKKFNLSKQADAKIKEFKTELQNLGVDVKEGGKVFNETLKEVYEEIQNTGELSKDTYDSFYSEVEDLARVKNSELYEGMTDVGYTSSDVRSYLKKNPINWGEVKKDAPKGWGTNSKNFGTFTFSNNASSYDTLLSEMQGLFPNLIDYENINGGYEFVNEVQDALKNLDKWGKGYSNYYRGEFGEPTQDTSYFDGKFNEFIDDLKSYINNGEVETIENQPEAKIVINTFKKGFKGVLNISLEDSNTSKLLKEAYSDIYNNGNISNELYNNLYNLVYENINDDFKGKFPSQEEFNEWFGEYFNNNFSWFATETIKNSGNKEITDNGLNEQLANEQAEENANYWANNVPEDIGDQYGFSEEYSQGRKENQEFSKEETSDIDKQYQEAIDKYGVFDKGMNPRKDVKVPQANEKGKTSQGARTIDETEGLINDETKFKKDIIDGKYNYVQYINKETWDKAVAELQSKGADAIYNELLSTQTGRTDVHRMARMEVLAQEFSRTNDARLYDITTMITTESSNAAQVLQYMTMLKKMSPTAKLASLEKGMAKTQAILNEKMGNTAPTLAIDEQLRDNLLNAKTSEEIENASKAIQDSIQAQIPEATFKQFIEMSHAWRYLSMLGSPSTHIKNILGNVISLGMSNLKDVVGAVGEEIATKVSKKEFTRTKTLFNPFSKEYRQAYKLGKEVYQEYKSAIEATNKYETVKDPFKAKFLGKWLSKYLNWRSNLNSKLLDAEDFIFSSKRFAQSYARYLLANKVDLNNVSTEIKVKASDYAMLEAQKTTFRDFSKTADTLNKLVKKGGALGVIVDTAMPFRKTNINVSKRGFEYSPGGLLVSLFKGGADLKKGKITTAQYIDGLASGLTGTGIVALGAFLAYLGIFRTKDEDTDRKQDFDEENGEQDYSIDLSFLGIDGTYTISWATPFTLPFAIGAECYNALSSLDGVEDFDALEFFYNIALKMLDPLIENSAFDGFDKILTSISYSKTKGEKAVNFIAGLVSTYVSQYFSTTLSKVARAIDGTQRNTSADGKIEQMVKQNINKVPFLSKTLEPKIDLEGNEKKNVGSNFFTRLAYNMLSPGYYSANTVDEYDQEYYRLYEETGDMNVFPSSSVDEFKDDKISYSIEGKDLTEYQKTRWSKEKELVDNFIDSEEYQNYTDEERVATIKSLRSYAGDIAKDEFLAKQNVDYDDKAYANIQEAEDNGVDAYKYFLTKNYYNNLSGDEKKSDYIDYLNNADMSSEAKNYMYSTQYGDSKGYGYVQDLDTDDDTKFKIYEIMADTKADVDENGDTISNSKAKKIREQYEQLGVYDQIVEYVNTHEDVSWSSFGLTKTVVGQTSKKGNTSDSDLKGSTTTKSKVSTNTLKSGKSSKTTTQNGSSSVSSGNNSSNSLNLRKFTGANTVLNSSSKGTISQNGKKLDDDYLNAYSKVFRKSLI